MDFSKNGRRATALKLHLPWVANTSGLNLAGVFYPIIVVVKMGDYSGNTG
jgi:hypothetical protein